MEAIALHSDVGQVGFQPYVLDLTGLNLESPDASFTLALVVMRRPGGLLLCLPEHALSEEALLAGDFAGPDELLGPHTVAALPAASLVEESPLSDPVAVAAQMLSVLLVDISSMAAAHLTPVASLEDLDGVLTFDPALSLLVPLPDALVAHAISWAQDPSERLQFYSATEDVPETPAGMEEAASPKATPTRRRAPAVGTPGGGTQKKKATVASLAESLDAVVATLPQITTQLAELSQRTSLIEEKTGKPDRISALRQPLGSSLPGGSSVGLSPQDLLKKMPPPRSISTQPKAAPHVTFSREEVAEAELDFPEGSALAQAVLQQSKALTALVSQLASGDHAVDLASSSTGLSNKGSLGRARLQSELAQHKGTFFLAVLQNMARRMYPAQNADQDAAQLLARGVTATQYLERFGGYGKTRDLGFLAWQTGMVMNFLQEENIPAAKDSLALMMVCLEQSAMDNGNMNLGLLLALVEDPPYSLFSQRSLASSPNPRPFAPLASQKWATVALQYLREMDLISTRRAEATQKGGGGGNAANTGAASSQDGKNAQAKPNPKRKGRGRGKANAAEPEEDQ